MHKAHLIICGMVSVLTPVLVLANSLLGAAAAPFTPVHSLQSMALAQWLMYSGLENLVAAGDFLMQSPELTPQAQIMFQEGQFFLEFYTPFNAVDQTPELTLVLAKTPIPDITLVKPDQSLPIGKLQAVAGTQRYPIPSSVDIQQYRAVIIWCPELSSIIGYTPVSLAL